MTARHRTILGLALLLAIAGGLRLWAAAGKSLILDEFHAYYHASAPDLGTFLARLRLDNHPPLGFLSVLVAKRTLGDAELALRAPALVLGLFEITLIAALGRRLLDSRRGWVAGALLAVSSLHLDFTSMARMYALLSLALTALTVAVLTALERAPRGRLRAPLICVGAACFVGLHAHYYFVHYVLAIAAATAFIAWREPERRRVAAALAGAAAIGALLALPWYLWGFRTQLQHGLPPGGDDIGPAALAEAMVHLFYVNVRLGGPLLRLVFIGCGGLAALLGGIGALRLLRGSPTRRRAALLLGTVAFAVPVLATVVAALLPRAGFTWHYVLPSAAALAVLCAAALGTGGAPRTRSAGVATVAAFAALLCVLNARSVATQDYRGAVRSMLAGARPGDAVISVEWQPALFPQGQPWDYYSPRLVAAEAAPTRLAMNEAFYLADPSALRNHERALLLRTALPNDAPLLALLRGRYASERTESHGFGVWVHRFESPRP